MPCSPGQPAWLCIYSFFWLLSSSCLPSFRDILTARRILPYFFALFVGARIAWLVLLADTVKSPVPEPLACWVNCSTRRFCLRRLAKHSLGLDPPHFHQCTSPLFVLLVICATENTTDCNVFLLSLVQGVHSVQRHAACRQSILEVQGENRLAHGELSPV